jgi:hypothetical protein
MPSLAPSLAAPNQGNLVAVAYKTAGVPLNGVDVTAAKIAAHPSQLSHASVVVRTDGQARVHGTIAASALIASISGANASAPIGQAVLPRAFGYPSTNFGPFQMLTPDQDIIGDRDPLYPMIIGPGQGFVVRIENVASPLYAMPSNQMIAGEIAWREFDPTLS